MIPRIARALDDHYWTARFLAVEALAMIAAVRLGGTR